MNFKKHTWGLRHVSSPVVISLLPATLLFLSLLYQGLETVSRICLFVIIWVAIHDGGCCTRTRSP